MLEKQVDNQMAAYTTEKIKNLYKFLDDKEEEKPKNEELKQINK